MVFALAKNEPTYHDPLRMAQPTAPRPTPVENKASGCQGHFSCRRRRRSDAGGFVSAPDIVLRLFRKMRQDASMVAKIVQAPGRGPASRFAELKGYVERNLMIVFVTAPALRLKDVNQTGSKVFVNRFLRNVAIAFSPHSSLAQLRRQRASAGDKFVGSRNIARLSARPQVGDAHERFLQLGERCASSQSGSSLGYPFQ